MSMASYTCSYCKTGVMNTPDQYITHITGIRHKKKAFNLQAPFEGIEYEEFRTKKPNKPSPQYVPKDDEFPTLDGGAPAPVKPISPLINYDILKDSIKAKEPVVVISDDEDNDNEEQDEECSYFPSIDDIFNNCDSRPSSAYYAVEKYLKRKSTAAQAINEVAQNMNWELRFELATSKTDRYKYELYADNILIGEGEGENKKSAKQESSAVAIKDVKRRLEVVLKGNKVPGTNVPPNIQNNTASSTNAEVEYHPADAYRKLAFDKLQELEFAHRNVCAVPRRFAAFIITDQLDQLAKDGTVVAFGAGEGRLSDSDVRDTCLELGFGNLPGYFIKNFDCVVMARRSLQCFLYNQLLMFFDSKRADSRREKNFLDMGKNGFVTFKDGVRLHLYLSHAPYGDCTESIPSNFEDPEFLPRKESDRDKLGNMEPLLFMTYSNNQYIKLPGHIRVWHNNDSNLLGSASNRKLAITSTTSETRYQGKWTSVLEYRTKTKHSTGIHLTMSPTDKLTYWIHIGVQGAFLSHLMAPVYLYSIQIGKDYMHQHISRALLCRVPLDSLKESYGDYYKLNTFTDPFLERVHQVAEHPSANRYVKNLDVSFNWYLNPVSNCAEVIDNKTGCVHGSSPFKLPYGKGGSATGDQPNTHLCSRLSKVCMLVRLRECFEAAVNYYARKPELRRTRDIQGIYEASGFNYRSWKVCASDYRRLKWTLFDLLRQKRYGDWQPNEESNKFNLLEMYELYSPDEIEYDDAKGTELEVHERNGNAPCRYENAQESGSDF